MRYTVSGTATPGSDYEALTGTLSLGAGQNTATLLVNPVNDNAFEPNETVVATLTADPAYGIGASASGTVTIESDDIQPPEPTSLQVSRVFDNKNGKSYFPGGPDGADPYNEVRSLSENQNLEVENGSSFWWQLQFENPATNLGDPTQVMVDLSYRAESDYSGTFRAEYRVGSQLLTSIDLPVDSSGQTLTNFTWDLSSVVTALSDLTNGEVRLINTGGNGKKIFANFAAIGAVLGGTAPLPAVAIVAS